MMKRNIGFKSANHYAFICNSTGSCILAGGTYSGSYNPEQSTTLLVTAEINNTIWPIIQSPFKQQNARTTAFDHKTTITNGKMAYLENTTVEVYAKIYEPSDQNE